MISYGKCTKAQYEALTPVQDRIYYITDTGEQYLNGMPYNGEDRRDYLCLTARQASTNVSLDKSNASMSDVNLEYSTDRRNWTKYTWDSSTGAGTTITLSALGDKVYFRGDNTTFTSSSSNRFSFTIIGKADPSGNIMSLLDKTCELKEIPDTGGRMFYMLFGSASQTDTIVDASGLRLPATTLAAYCYGSLFAGQTGLTTANFELPAVAMKDNCYRGMFNGCQSLALPPELPATILATGCYSMMFRSCYALAKAPKLPATTLAQNCYQSMFNSCSALSQVEVSFTDWQSSYAPTDNWLANVSATGVFKCPAGLDTSTTGGSNVPAGWTVVRTDASEALLVPTNGVVGQVLTKTATGTQWSNGGGVVFDGEDPLWVESETTSGSFSILYTAGWIGTIEYSYDKVDWTSIVLDGTQTTPLYATVPFSNGRRVYLRKNAPNTSTQAVYIYGQTITRVGGNLSSMNTSYSGTAPAYEFHKLFAPPTSVNTTLRDISELKVPLRQLGANAMTYLFQNCTKLYETMPIPVAFSVPGSDTTTYLTGSWTDSFAGCTSLAKINLTMTDGNQYTDKTVGLYRITDNTLNGVISVEDGTSYIRVNCTDIAPNGKFSATAIGLPLLQNVQARTSNNLNPGSPYVPHYTVGSGESRTLTLNSTVMDAISGGSNMVYGEVIIDCDANGTVSYNSTYFSTDSDPVVQGKRNWCVYRVLGNTAKMYVVDTQDLPQA